MSNPPDTRKRDDLITVVSIAIVAFALANILHEGVGHGGVCVLLGGKAKVLSSMHFQGEIGDPLGWQNKLVTAGGTIVNLLASAVGYTVLGRAGFTSSSVRYFLWLFSLVNLLQATGYFLFSGLLNVGDWSEVIAGFPTPWLWRSLMILVGGVSYYVAVRRGFQILAGRLGGDTEERIRRATRLAVASYFTGGMLYLVAGLLNPIGIVFVFFSAVAASFGGASGLLWGPQLLRGRPTDASAPTPLVVDRSALWIASAILAALIFILLLGPGIHFT